MTAADIVSYRCSLTWLLHLVTFAFQGRPNHPEDQGRTARIRKMVKTKTRVARKTRKTRRTRKTQSREMTVIQIKVMNFHSTLAWSVGGWPMSVSFNECWRTCKEQIITATIECKVTTFLWWWNGIYIGYMLLKLSNIGYCANDSMPQVFNIVNVSLVHLDTKKLAPWFSASLHYRLPGCFWFHLAWMTDIVPRHWVHMGPEFTDGGSKPQNRKNCLKRAEKVRHLVAINADKFPPSCLEEWTCLFSLQYHCTGLAIVWIEWMAWLYRPTISSLLPVPTIQLRFGIPALWAPSWAVLLDSDRNCPQSSCEGHAGHLQIRIATWHQARCWQWWGWAEALALFIPFISLRFNLQ